ncbi:hypothetical protein QQ045_018780 [Rhodiola kirilowii]
MEPVSSGNDGTPEPIGNTTSSIPSSSNSQKSKGSDIRNQMLLAKDKCGIVGNFQFDNERARAEIVDFIIRAELPFTFVDTHDFAVMDPRFKLLAIESWLSLYDLSHIDIEIKVASVRAVLHQLYDTYKRNMLAACMPAACNNMPATSDALEPEIDVNIPVVPSASMAKLKRARVSNSGASTDLQMYLDLDTLDMDEKGNFNVLEWWKANSSMYPVLSLMARDLLSIPTSTVASEAAFSAGGRVVSEKKASLSPNTIEALICLKDWSLASSRKQDAAAEEYAAEELMNARASQPDWLLDGAELPETVSDNSAESAEENPVIVMSDA